MNNTLARIEAKLDLLNQEGLEAALTQVDFVCMIPSMLKGSTAINYDLNVPFSVKIKAGRKKRGWTQQQLADKCGLSMMTIRRYEKYGRTPRLSEAKRILDIIDGGADYD